MIIKKIKNKKKERKKKARKLLVGCDKVKQYM